jgi:hypothetical protein
MTTLPLGQIVTTSNAASTITERDILIGLKRHRHLDWGDVCLQDQQSNDEAVKSGERILSVYHSEKGEKFWIITEWDRSVTTVLMPSDY